MLNTQEENYQIALAFETLADVYESPDNWCKEYFSRDKFNNSIDLFESKAVSWCLLGGLTETTTLMFEYNNDSYSLYRKTVKHLRNLVGSIMVFNDEQENPDKIIHLLREEAEILRSVERKI